MRDEVVVGPNRVAVEAVVASLRDLGRLERLDEAVVTAALELASVIDETRTRAGLWKEYLVALDKLMAAGSGGSDDLNELLGDLRSSVGDAEAAGT